MALLVRVSSNGEASKKSGESRVNSWKIVRCILGTSYVFSIILNKHNQRGQIRPSKRKMGVSHRRCSLRNGSYYELRM